VFYEIDFEKLIEHIGDCDDSEYLRVVCRAIERFPDGDLPPNYVPVAKGA